jgi:pectinesterase
VDFICPRGWCYVTDCTFYEWKAGSAATWHDGSKGQDMKFVLRNCKFDGTNGWVLARHHIEAQFYYLDCKFSQTMADKQPKRVIYPVDKAATNSAALATNEANAKKNLDLDSKNIWGERAYFWNCLHDGGDFAWHSNNLASAVGAPTAEQITAAWTFAGKWNPENKVGPKILSVKAEMGRVTLTFSERVTVKAKPKLVLNNGGLADFASGSGSDTLAFEITGASDKPGKAVSLDLNGGAIIATEASATLRPAEIAWPK